MLGHLVGLVGYTLLLKKSTLGKLNKLFTATLMQTGVFLPSLLFLVFGKITFQHSVFEWTIIVLGGATLAVYMIANVYALSHLDASLFTLIFNLRIVVVTFFGFVLLHEAPTLLQVVGGLVILVSIAMLNLHKNNQWRTKAIAIGTFTMLWFSLHAIFEKYNLRFWDTPSYIFYFLLVATVLLWAILLYKRIDVRAQIKHIEGRSFLLLMITRALSGYAYIYALAHGSLAVTSYISSMSVVLIVLFGIYFLGERTHLRQKLIAAAVACVGMSLILLSKLQG